MGAIALVSRDNVGLLVDVHRIDESHLPNSTYGRGETYRFEEMEKGISGNLYLSIESLIFLHGKTFAVLTKLKKSNNLIIQTIPFSGTSKGEILLVIPDVTEIYPVGRDSPSGELKDLIYRTEESFYVLDTVKLEAAKLMDNFLGKEDRFAINIFENSLIIAKLDHKEREKVTFYKYRML